MLELDESLKIGNGVDRVVYCHPENPELCIKIARCNVESEYKISGLRDWIYYAFRRFDKSYFDFNFTDVRYAGKLDLRTEPDVYEHIPRCYGFVETNLGRGVVWQRIRNYDGSDCLSLKECCEHPGILGPDQNRLLWDGLEHFFQWQMRQRIMLREMAFVNTLVCRVSENAIHLYHIDAIGCVDLIPLADWLDWFAAIRIWSKVRSFRRRIVKRLAKP